MSKGGITCFLKHFVSGQVKQADMVRYPPYGYPTPTQSYNMLPTRASYPGDQMCRTGNRSQNKFNNHAKRGFKYWYEEKKGGTG